MAVRRGFFVAVPVAAEDVAVLRLAILRFFHTCSG
ncbi:hypothetical protein Pgy4_40712 [Pseudomonas savastanoi pv. glycinea str. race 4]|uniref:Uncharacterized protein n=1 Tax=Pseudomonas savastanoi pv. glycinea str. race 4 TaxID=875330 RepID=F3CJ68_PSESG|nr:hypothetical protein Pgy4_40712 [Pseudomonas savastanoi pv. glycinea str. race 4]